MSAHWFDELTRSLAVRRSRRRLLGGVATGIAGAAIGRTPAGVAGACPEGQVAAAGNRCVCRTTGRPPVNGVCPCPPGATACGGGCVSCGGGTAVNPATCTCCISGGVGGCLSNGDCCSGVCVGGVCSAGQQPPGGGCDDNTDCASGLCCAPVCASTALGGWTPTSSGTGASVSTVCGPATPPLPPESAQLTVGADGNNDAQLRTAAYNGLPLSSFTQLGYSTYVVQDGSGGQAPYIMLRVDYDGNGSEDDIWFFEPEYQSLSFYPSNPQGPLAVGVWQTWDALNGGWYSLNGVAGSGPGANVKSFATLVAAQPTATLATSTEGIRIAVGFGAVSWDNFIGNVDNANVNGTVYDF